MAITPLPTPVPQRSDPANFPARADAFMTALPVFGTEANALQVDVNNKQVIATNASNTALGAMQAAQAAQAAAEQAGQSSAWVSGSTYAAGTVRYSLINYQNYRRSVTGAGTTDPSLDATNWVAVGQYAGVQVFTANGTFSPRPGANYYMIDLVAGGGSGAAGTSTNAGGGGGGERPPPLIIPASLITTNVTVEVGAGGAAVTAQGNTANIDRFGVQGGYTKFGSFLEAVGGGGGQSSGGGVNGGYGGALGRITANSQIEAGLGRYGSLFPQPVEYAGGTGGSPGTSGASSLRAGGGGGAASANNSSNGGGSGVFTPMSVSGGLGGAAGTSVSLNGSAGNNSSTFLYSGAGGGGSFGGGSGARSGGNGGFPGGGGGAAFCNDSINTATSGKGGDGIARIYWW